METSLEQLVPWWWWSSPWRQKSSRSQHLEVSSGGGCAPGPSLLLPLLERSSTPRGPLSAVRASDFSLPTLVCHLVSSSPKGLGVHVQGFWPIEQWGLLQLVSCRVGPPRGCFSITQFIFHTCSASAGSQETWPSPGVVDHLRSGVTILAHHCPHRGPLPSPEACAWFTQVLTKASRKGHHRLAALLRHQGCEACNTILLILTPAVITTTQNGPGDNTQSSRIMLVGPRQQTSPDGNPEAATLTSTLSCLPGNGGSFSREG